MILCIVEVWQSQDTLRWSLEIVTLKKYLAFVLETSTIIQCLGGIKSFAITCLIIQMGIIMRIGDTW